TGEVVHLEALITSTAPQFIFAGSTGFPVTAISTHPNSTFSWGTLNGSAFTPFSPAVTSATHSAGFDTPGVYQVACVVENQWGDKDTTDSYEVTVESVGLDEANGQNILVINQLDNWAINFTESNFVQPTLQLIDMSGRTIFSTNKTTQGWNVIPAPSNAGVYILRMIENDNVYHVKLVRSN
ncbi:MAG TPA: T9SS type A sorting domain-containing protein, partial [Bacteroidia bacterium]